MYSPRCNGQAKVTNKILKFILTKVVNTEQGPWDTHIHAALWAYQIAYKVTTKQTPFGLAFGQKAIVPFIFMVPVLRTLVQPSLDT